MLPQLIRRWPARRPLSVLDVGCGNARFAPFLRRSGRPFTYFGVDASSRMLRIARAALGATPLRRRSVTADPIQRCEIQRVDLVGAPSALPRRRFDLIVAFGLLHHIPGETTRLRLMAALRGRLRPDGLLIVTLWQFLTAPRYRGRIVPWSQLPRGRHPIDLSQLEAGDTLLSWGRAPRALRFCHSIDPSEARRLVRGARLRCLETFAADGRSGALNLYLLLQRR